MVGFCSELNCTLNFNLSSLKTIKILSVIGSRCLMLYCSTTALFTSHISITILFSNRNPVNYVNCSPVYCEVRRVQPSPPLTLPHAPPHPQPKNCYPLLSAKKDVFSSKTLKKHLESRSWQPPHSRQQHTPRRLPTHCAVANLSKNIKN